MRYLDADTIADARNALGCQVPIERIAAHLGVTVDELRQALGMPQWKAEPAKSDRQLSLDLWACDRLDGVL